MADETTFRFMTKTEYAKHRGVSQPYISKLARNGILVMRGGKIDVVATDQVLDDKPLPEIEEPPPIRTPPPRAPDAVRMEQMPARGGNDRDQKTTYAEARTIRTVFQAKLARLEFETKQGKLIEAEGVRLRISEHVRALRDGLLGLPDRLASTLAAETDQRKVHVLLRTEITRELEALAHALGGV
jgi:phage terminase Nu1 subunit (DNA packaging protein)